MNALPSKLNVIYEDYEEDPKILVNKIRVHFFFTQDEKQSDFWKFLSNTEIEIKLTDGPYWEGKMLGSTSGFPLQHFNDQLEV